MNLRVFHRLAPFVHHGGPPFLNMGRTRNYIRSVEGRKLSLIRWRLVHPPKESTLRIWGMRRNVQRSLGRIQSRDNVETRFMSSASWFLCVFQGHTDLITKFRVLVWFEVFERLIEVILHHWDMRVSAIALLDLQYLRSKNELLSSSATRESCTMRAP